MARQRTSPIEDVIHIVSKTPWWVGFTLAVLSYLVLHAVASRPIMPPSTNPGQMGAAAVRGLTTTLAAFGQFVLPLAFGLGAVISAVGAARQKKLFDTTAARPGVSALNDMSWQEFERLVGEYYRRKGFQVTREGGNGPDGGVDLVLRQKDELYLVQCKQWRAFKVGVQPVREFYGVMAARGAAGGYFVTSGEYTPDAKEFTKGRNLELIDGRRLKAMIEAAKSPRVQTPVEAVPTPAASPRVQTPTAAVPPAAQKTTASPACPKCGSEMTRRVARQGSHAGKNFWGCSTYPKCRGAVPID
jgi:restriction system protein